jgi:predicted dehydrogenase
MDQVKLGVIGVGVMGQRHCRVYSNLRHAQFVGVFDAVPEAGRRVAQEYGVVSYGHVDDLLEQVDAVSLAVPTPLHFDLATHCLARGVHVLIEKPITETLAQGEALARTVEAGNLIVQVGHIERFNPAYLELKNVLDGMTVLAVNLRRLSAYEGSNTDVDVVLDLMIHDIDLVCDLMGREPAAIDAYGLTAFSGALDHVLAHFDFETGPLLTVTASRITEQKVRSIEVTALEAYVEADLLNKTILVHRRTIGEYQSLNHRGVKYRQESIVERIHVPTFEPLFLELQHFVDCIREHQQPSCSARDGLRALRLAQSVQQATAGCRIDVHQAAKTAGPGSLKPELSALPG